ncbi:hypothetical protein UA08_00363 [Talaromyces atroroseus]|uniref:Phosphatidylinositol transfer protein SFH5 n=1 Tax=Talaromyces atroroseus TaxID=1441469 RepID=A0A225BCE9_TALAT|nr:hypothetical protein UA08_00363 [Talaromyces atroroseus]OKL64595.1 hypothetical protein UA08_00363 [Talaromyces atroroseus]
MSAAEPAVEAVPQPVAETEEKAPEPTAAATPAAETTAEQKPETPAEPAADKPAETAAESTEKDDSADKKTEPEAPAKPAYLTKVPGLGQFFDSLPGILEKSGHPEMWGVTLKDSDDIPTVNVLIKFLRANEGNVKLAEEQLTKALEWRKQINPLELAKSAEFSAKKFGGLGYITSYVDPTFGETVFTWNLYGSVKDLSDTFGDLDEFIRWRTALMEKGVQELKLNEATEVIEYDGEDPYQMLQVHDYKGVSFLRLDPAVKAASKKTIEVFSLAYPELLREKFFINVPTIMGWVFGAMKVFLSKNTIRKFHPISNGANLGREFSYVEDLPKAYGGQGADLKEAGRTVPLIDDIPAGEPEKAPAVPAKDEAAKEEEPTEQAAKEEAGSAAEQVPAATEAPKEEAPKEEVAREEAPKEEATKEDSAKTEEPAKEEAAAEPVAEEAK